MTQKAENKSNSKITVCNIFRLLSLRTSISDKVDYDTIIDALETGIDDNCPINYKTKKYDSKRKSVKRIIDELIASGEPIKIENNKIWYEVDNSKYIC